MASLPADVCGMLARYQRAVGSVVTSAGVSEVASSSGAAPMPPLKRARAQLQLAQTMHTMTVMLLKAHGVGPGKGKASCMAAEATRLQQYERKVSKAESEEILRTERPAAVLDIAAANRFISAAAAPSLTAEQRQKLSSANIVAANRCISAAAAPSLTAEQRQKLRNATAMYKAADGAPAARPSAAGTEGRAGGPGGASERREGGAGRGATPSARDAALQFLSAIDAEALGPGGKGQG
ncbi:hypothetical protein FOA52_010870 [Chlamydomonas sp. UWO 241]|nr:hypothetical protein FOA52_010870 [Chlamydomonas sp. UWO 241]